MRSNFRLRKIPLDSFILMRGLSSLGLCCPFPDPEVYLSLLNNKMY